MEDHRADFIQNPTLEDIIAVDAWARVNVKNQAKAKKLIVV